MTVILGTLIICVGFVVVIAALINIFILLSKTRKLNAYRQKQLAGVSQRRQAEAQAYINQQITKRDTRNLAIYFFGMLFAFAVAGYVLRMIVTGDHGAYRILGIVVAVLYGLIAFFATLSRNLFSRTQTVIADYQQDSPESPLPLVLLPDDLAKAYVHSSKKVSVLATTGGLLLLVGAMLI